MNYTVVWSQSAERLLADLWLQANQRDRPAIATAANEIDQWLRRDAHNLGESRPSDRRILLNSPLGVVFKVYRDDRLVRVLKVWRFRAGGALDVRAGN
jgi:hypothetical protein